jgi:hypothetical protein
MRTSQVRIWHDLARRGQARVMPSSMTPRYCCWVNCVPVKGSSPAWTPVREIIVRMFWLGMLIVISFVPSSAEEAPDCKAGRLTWKGSLPPDVTSAFVCGDRWESPSGLDVALTVVDPKIIRETLFLIWQAQSPKSLQLIRIPAIPVSGYPIKRGFRYPQTSADRRSLYFLLIRAMHGQRLYSVGIAGARVSKPVNLMNGVEECCVIRGGRHDGKLVVSERGLGANTIEYRNVLLDGKSSARVVIPQIPGVTFFDKSVEAWLRPTGGQCALPPTDGYIDELWAKVLR